MICLKCGCEDSRVINSREKEEYTYRRRECVYCGNRFTTAEIHIEEYERLKSNREKLQCSIERLNCAADAMNGLLIGLKDLGVSERRYIDA